MSHEDDARAFVDWLLADGSKGRRKQNGTGNVTGRCPRPTHEDKHPSFQFYLDGDGWACSCGRGKGSELRQELGFTPSEVSQTARPKAQPNGVPREDKPKAAPTRPPDCIHEYAAGNRKLKWRGEDKAVRWEHQAEGGWKVGMHGDPGLYHQAAIADADLVCLSESESDADALTLLGFVAVSVAFGAGVPPREDQAKLFKDKHVAIFEHQDEPGRKFSEATIDALCADAEEVFIVKPPDGYKDVRDWIVAESPEHEEVTGLIDNARPKELIAVPASELFPTVADQVDWLLYPLIARGCLVQIQGNPKGGKSCFGLYIAMSMASGRWMSDRFEYVRSGPCRALYVAYEDGLKRLKRRFKEYSPGLGIDPDRYSDNLLFFQRSPDIDLSKKSGEGKVRKIIKKNGCDVLFFDTLSWIHDGEENSKKEMQPVMTALRRIIEDTGISIVLVHHTRKSSHGGDVATTAERGRGSSAISAAADAILDFGSRVQKNVTFCRLISKDVKDDEFHVVYDENEETGAVNWRLIDAEEREDVTQARAKVLSAVKELCRTAPEGVLPSTVAAAVSGLSEASIRRCLKTLVMKKELERIDGAGAHRGNLYRPCQITT